MSKYWISQPLTQIIIIVYRISMLKTRQLVNNIFLYIDLVWKENLVTFCIIKLKINYKLEKWRDTEFENYLGNTSRLSVSMFE